MRAIFYPDAPLETLFIHAILDEIYTKKIYDNFKGGVVVDLGANIGLTTQYFQDKADKVYAVEPGKENFEVLNRSIKFNNLDNVEPINVAISDRDGQTELFYNLKNQTSQSLLQNNKQGSETVNIASLDSLFKKYKIKEVDFMKVDIEGAEEILFYSRGFKAVAPNIKSMLVEFHTNNKEEVYKLVKRLEKLGFKLKDWKMHWIGYFER